MKDIGKRTSNTEKDKKPGLMVHSMMVTMSMGRSMERELLSGQTVRLIEGISLIIIFMATGHINGLMVENILVIGEIIRCMEEESSNGLMAEDMKVTM